MVCHFSAIVARHQRVHVRMYAYESVYALYLLPARTPSCDCVHTDIQAYARVSAGVCSGCFLTRLYSTVYCCVAACSCCRSTQGTQAAQVYVPMQNRLMSSTTTTAKAAGQSAAIRVVAIAAVAAVYKIFFGVHINQAQHS